MGISLGRFLTKFLSLVHGQVHGLLGIKICADSLKGFRSNYEGLSLGVCALPQTFSAPSGETVNRTRTCFEGARMIQSSFITLEVWWARTSHAARGRKSSTFLFVCLSVTLLNDKVCERHFAINAMEYGNDFGRPTVG